MKVIIQKKKSTVPSDTAIDELSMELDECNSSIVIPSMHLDSFEEQFHQLSQTHLAVNDEL